MDRYAKLAVAAVLGFVGMAVAANFVGIFTVFLFISAFIAFSVWIGREVGKMLKQIMLKYNLKDFDPKIVRYDPSQSYLVIKIVGSDVKDAKDAASA